MNKKTYTVSALNLSKPAYDQAIVYTEKVNRAGTRYLECVQGDKTILIITGASQPSCTTYQVIKNGSVIERRQFANLQEACAESERASISKSHSRK